MTEEEKKKKQAEAGERAQVLATLGEDLEDVERIGREIKAEVAARKKEAK